MESGMGVALQCYHWTVGVAMQCYILEVWELLCKWQKVNVTHGK